MKAVIAVLLATSLVTGPALAQDKPLPLGAWSGRAALDSGAVEQGAPVTLRIAATGAVTGTIGDAELTNARIERNRSVLARLFNLGTTWVIAGELRGPIRASDNLTRSHVTLPVSLIDGELRGDLNASGGGRLLSVQLRLQRTGAP